MRPYRAGKERRQYLQIGIEEYRRDDDGRSLSSCHTTGRLRCFVVWLIRHDGSGER